MIHFSCGKSVTHRSERTKRSEPPARAESDVEEGQETGRVEQD